MFDIGLGTALGAGLNFIGGHLRDEAAEDRQRWAFEQNSNLQREFAQHGIRWRVEDAQAAGVHPLYALGSGVTPASPIHVGDSPGGMGSALASMGQDISRATRATMTPEQRAEHNAKIAVMESQADANSAQAQFYRSRAFRNTTEDGPAQANPEEASFWRGATTRPVKDPQDGILVQPMDQQMPRASSAVLVEPDKAPSMRSGDPSMSAAGKPAFSEYNLTRFGTKIRLPYSSEGISEALEGVPWYLWPAILVHNANYYGQGWMQRMLSEFVFDKAPQYKQHGSRSYSPGTLADRRDWQALDPFHGDDNMGPAPKHKLPARAYQRWFK